jgi:hypothetical protein
MGRKDEPLPAITFEADAVVAEILGDASRRQEELKLSPEERKKLIASRRKTEAKKDAARQKAQAQKPNRMHLLLPQALKETLAQLALEHRVTEAQVVTFLLYESLARYEQGQVDLGAYLYPSANARYDFNLIHPKDTERVEKLTSKRKKRDR